MLIGQQIYEVTSVYKVKTSAVKVEQLILTFKTCSH